MFGFDDDSMASYYAEQGFDAVLSGEEEDQGVNCKFCHRGPFFWDQVGTASKPKWRLSTADGNIHQCKAHAKEQS